MPGNADTHFIVRAADPGELGRLKLDTGTGQQLIEGSTAADRAHCGSVSRSGAVEPVREPQASSAFHVARHDRRAVRQVLGKMARQQSRIEVVGTSDAVTDVKIEALVLEEITGRLRQNGARQNGRDSREHPSAHAPRGLRPAGEVRAWGSDN